jgi:FkbM family methyltransferase
MINKVIGFLGLTRRKLIYFFLGIKKPGNSKGVWIDVGAHLGEITLTPAKVNPSLIVYAFEPNITLAMQLIGIAGNFVVIPMAVSEKDGCADFHVNQNDSTSSLLSINPEGVKKWTDIEGLAEERQVSVPTIRLDTFMDMAKIKQVDFLKIDTQGTDLAVVKSAGDRIKDIKKISLEVLSTPSELYLGSDTKEATVAYLTKQGFELVETKDHNRWLDLTFVQKPH